MSPFASRLIKVAFENFKDFFNILETNLVLLLGTSTLLHVVPVFLRLKN